MTCELPGGAIFLHIPKTGGTWVFEVLTELGLVKRTVGRHPHADYTRAVFYPNHKARWKEWEGVSQGGLFNRGSTMKFPFTFCFVRHPAMWYVSWWRYLTGGRFQADVTAMSNADNYMKRWHPNTVATRAFDNDFSTFVRNVHKAFPGYVTWMYNLYAPPEISFVGKQETLTDDLIAVLGKLNITADETRIRNWPRSNESKQKAEAKWDTGLLAEVQAAELAGIKRFGYEVLEK